MDTSQYKALFLQETEEHLKGVTEELLHLENAPDDSAAIDNLFRHFHSIKGMSASMGYEGMASFSHQLEDLLDGLRKKRITGTQEIMDTLLTGADILQAFTRLIAEDKPCDIDTSLISSRIKAILTSEEKPPAPSLPSSPVQAAMPKLGLPATMKVDGKIFDNFMGSVGELFTVRSRLKGIVTNSFPVEFQEAAHQLGRIIEDLYYSVITARMIPFEDLTQNLPRIVRDMCKQSGKDVELLIHGSDVKLDRAVLEHMTDPLVHIIRNAVDHGIETPEERARLGKPAKGHITVAVARQRDNIIIEINDDGRGIDINKVKEKAMLSGIPEGRLHTMSEKEILLLVCTPGLSLAKEITASSGRGVGMDVVKANVEAIGGRVEISSVVKQGTKIILEIPVTISIVKVLLVSLGDELFALPISKVLKVLDVDISDIKSDKPLPYFIYDDIEAPVMELRSVMAMPPPPQKNPVSIVIIDAKDKISGIIVDDFEGEIDAYIKPLSQPMARMKAVIGVTVLGDGRPVFLLDPAALINV
ncbi:MAG: chemotaxis protein CheA [Deltaproteobacteria bacterium]|nr:chemotaxis protein CheA [Deltaproteobacteria bacterium]